MKLFKSVKSDLAVLGIFSSDNLIGKPPSKVKSLLMLYSLFMSSVFCSVFLFYEAQDFGERTSSFYNVITINIIAIEFAIYIWKSEKIFKFVVDLEEFIEKSE